MAGRANYMKAQKLKQAKQISVNNTKAQLTPKSKYPVLNTQYNGVMGTTNTLTKKTPVRPIRRRR